MDAASDSARPDEVRDELERIAAGRHFRQSPALTRFLRFTVQASLEGRGKEIKETVLGIEVFRRGIDFDPRLDPVVRVHAGKLRSRLKEYYEAEGSADPVIIEYPKGCYRPVFRRWLPPAVAPESVPPVKPVERKMGQALLLGSAALAIAVVVLCMVGRPSSGQRVPPVRITFDSGSTTFPTISRDGNLIAYASDRAGEGNLDIWAQEWGGGEPVRLTTHPATDRTPDLSPDGRFVVFQSERDGGGIYLSDVVTRGERRLTGTGWRPRFSPRGDWIVYQAQQRPAGGSGLYLIPTSGGSPEGIRIEGAVALAGGSPTFTPDGDHVLFQGAAAPNDLDWWVVPRRGGRAARTGVAERLRATGAPPLTVHTSPGGWFNDEVIFSLGDGYAMNLWRIRLVPGTWRTAGPPRQVTYGTAREHEPRVSAGGRLVFTSETTHTGLFDVSVSPPIPLTSDASLIPGSFRLPQRFSARSGLLAYASARAGNSDVRILDLASGRESVAAAAAHLEDQPVLSADARRVAWRAREGMDWVVYVADTSGASAKRLAQDCATLHSWSPDGAHVFCSPENPERLFSVDALSGTAEEILLRPGWTVEHFEIAPDGASALASLAPRGDRKNHGYVFRFARGRPDPPERWINMPEEGFESGMHWAPDGGAILYVSRADDFACLWKQELDRRTLRPNGRPVPFRHFHDDRASPWSFWISAAPERIVMSLTGVNANIWTIQLSRN